MSRRSAAITPIARTLIDDTARLSTLPRVFGSRFTLVTESAIYQYAKRLSDYEGGYWDFYSLANGGFYMAPRRVSTFKVTSMNGFEENLSADATGIVVTLFAVNWLANKYEEESHIELYHALRDYAITHLEGEQIMRAID